MQRLRVFFACSKRLATTTTIRWIHQRSQDAAVSQVIRPSAAASAIMQADQVFRQPCVASLLDVGEPGAVGPTTRAHRMLDGSASGERCARGAIENRVGVHTPCLSHTALVSALVSNSRASAPCTLREAASWGGVASWLAQQTIRPYGCRGMNPAPKHRSTARKAEPHACRQRSQPEWLVAATLASEATVARAVGTGRQLREGASVCVAEVR
eukprot:1273345-Pleurochrysis_carterae.AAC.9